MEKTLRVLLITPPMTQLNTPYPATAYLTGFLKEHFSGVQSEANTGLRVIPIQWDASIDLASELFSSPGVKRIDEICRPLLNKGPSTSSFVQNIDRYLTVIDPVISFLQRKDPTLAYQIAQRGFLPEGPRFASIAQYEESVVEGLDYAFGTMGISDRARYLATLMINDIADVIRESIDSRFELSRYAERLAGSVLSFDPLEQALSERPENLVVTMLRNLTISVLKDHRPDLIVLTVPFPGNVFGALKIAQIAKEFDSGIKIALGGGYVNTELRSLQEPRLFRYVDFVALDDGEAPLTAIMRSLVYPSIELLRTFVLREERVQYTTTSDLHDIPIQKAGRPTYEGLDLSKYLSVLEVLNPMHRIWSDGRWNKLTLAHGCYWRKCSFCDISLDYISRFEDQSAEAILNKMRELAAETGSRGFHFVDEAAPPRTLFALSRKISESRECFTWWGNIRFERTFNAKNVAQMAKAGCIAVSGGLEVASDRLLKLMNKGVTVEQVARVTKNFSDHGVLVHAYLMYGFPTQTIQETIDSLERVRQLFLNGCIDSGYWHEFAATVHSPVGQHPDRFGVTTIPLPDNAFARNDIAFRDPTGIDHRAFAAGLNKAVYNYMHGLALDEDVRGWFDFKVPKAQVPKNLIAKALSKTQTV